METEQQWFEKDYKGKSIQFFTFSEQEYEVNSWKDFLMSILTLIKLKHNRDIEKLLTIKGRNSSFFSKNSQGLVKAEKISGSSIYAETNLSANQIVKLVYQIVKLFEYSDDSLSIELNE